MSIGSLTDNGSQVADLTRLAVAAQTARQPQKDASVAVEALQLRNVVSVATGRLDTYA